MAAPTPTGRHSNGNSNSASGGGGGGNNNKKQVGKEFICKVRYHNPLPEVPFPPKLLPIPPTYVDPNAGSYSQARLHHYVEYRHTTLEEATPYPMYIPAAQGAAKPAATAAASVPGLSRTASGATKRTFDHSVEGQLRAIEESFQYFAKYDDQPDGQEALLRNLRHPTNPNVHAVEALPLYPDSSLWPNLYTVFTLDTCPEPEFMQDFSRMSAEERQQLGDLARESLLFRPRMRQNHLGEDEQWIESFLPEDERPFEKSREYDMPVRPTALRQELYMLTFDREGDEPQARYVPIKARVMLKRRRVPLAVRQMEEQEDPLRITSLDLQLRDFSEDEIQERAVAMNKLHEVIREEIVHTSGVARNEDTDENVDIGGDHVFDSDDDNNRRSARNSRGRRNHHARAHSYSSASSQ
ncbi:Paf1-domain-containing protein [Kickxella alabastrina]|uniref:Paf1-domain-containing protein n=1 Tax=Kickxella alabastrina TaxID=61397 RepID=UPI0022200FF6|nr:Paf1-domain-containing protein [Kickxella alabastrina]KAI7827370.1 Paf1-domain-containing protein [Kickxella alabastrina]